MAREIERKFLVAPGQWSPGAIAGTRIRQGYLSTDPARIVRVRTGGDRAYLTIKGATSGIERAEYEYPMPPADAEWMLDHLCLQPLIEKTRYRVPFGGRTWEVDVFFGENAGLIIAEIELQSADERPDLPPWVGAEVSHDARYFNAALVARPYRT
jgi:CYTH domain-containing protein